MPRNQTKAGQKGGGADASGAEPLPRYLVDPGLAELRQRSLSVLIASRRCYSCQQADEETPVASSDPQEYIQRIAEHCGQTPDYLLPDSPIKEAIFRVILAGGNEPKTAEEISAVLLERWAMTAYPRELSPAVIHKLLDHGESYCIAQAGGPPAEPSDKDR